MEAERGTMNMSSAPFQSSRKVATQIAVFLVMLMGLTAPLRAQSIWELTPYRIQTWFVIQPQPLIPQNAVAELSAAVQREAGAALRSVWKVESSPVPDAYRETFLSLKQPTADDLLGVETGLEAFDKLFVFTVSVAGNGYQLDVCELDVRTRVWSPWQQRQTDRWSTITQEAFALMCDVFVPLVRIQRVQDDQVTALVKAGALQRPKSSLRHWQTPTEIKPGDVLQPIIRRTNRNGKVEPGGAKPIQWTVLLVEDQTGGVLTCKTFSGYRQPFNARRSSRVEQLALLIRPEHESTTLRLHDRRNKDQPLAGYDVFARKPSSKTSDFVGRTNWRGELEVFPNEENPIRILYVKSGNQLLGKLPVIPGYQPLLTAPLRNDDRRLEAEGFLLGIQESLVDLVARREVLTSRIRAKIDRGEFDEAEELLDQLRGLDTQEDFASRVQQRKQGLTAVDSQVQQKIDKLFADTRTLLGKFLDPSRVQQLQAEIEAARKGEPAANDEDDQN